MTDHRLGQHRALGDALVEAAILCAIQREAMGLPPFDPDKPDGVVIFRNRMIVIDSEGAGLAATDPLYEVAAVTLDRQGIITGEHFHSYVRPTIEPTGREWIFENSSLRPDMLSGAPSGQSVGVALRTYYAARQPVAVTAYNIAHDRKILDYHCSFQGNWAPCIMFKALPALRTRIPEESGDWPWRGHYHREKTSAERLAAILRDRGHPIPEWPDE